MNPRVDILILSRNRSWSLMHCIGSIREFTRWPYRILIQDHASGPEHGEHIARLAGPDCEIAWLADFLSCAEGRRKGLELVESKYVVFLDDDELVSPLWLTSMMEVAQRDPECAVVAGNILPDKLQPISAGRIVKGHNMIMLPYLAQGKCHAAAGGATLYETEALRKTEFRPEFNAGYEDWDQTLQIFTDQQRPILTSRASFFHIHQMESQAFIPDRWRLTELMDAAIAMWRQWRIKTAMEKTVELMLRANVPLQKTQLAALSEGMGV